MQAQIIRTAGDEVRIHLGKLRDVGQLVNYLQQCT